MPDIIPWLVALYPDPKQNGDIVLSIIRDKKHGDTITEIIPRSEVQERVEAAVQKAREEEAA